MKNRWKNAWKELRGNRGSGVLLVMVAIACITLMTTSLLHLTYTGFKIKAAERQSKVDFYTADSKMDELMAGVQNIVSAAIADAQKITLSEYITPQAAASASTEEAPEASTEFPSVDGETTETTDEETTEAPLATTTEAVQETTTSTEEETIVGTVDENNTKVFQKAFLDALEKRLGKSAGIYDADTLKNLFPAADTTVKIVDDANSTYTRSDVNKQFILHNVRLTYTSEKSGSTTSVKMDIVICVPDFLYIKAGEGAVNDNGKWDVKELVKFENWSTY